MLKSRLADLAVSTSWRRRESNASSCAVTTWVTVAGRSARRQRRIELCRNMTKGCDSHGGRYGRGWVGLFAVQAHDVVDRVGDVGASVPCWCGRARGGGAGPEARVGLDLSVLADPGAGADG